MYKIEKQIFPCATSIAMKFIGGKWKAVILIHLKDGAKRYNELKKTIPTITERTLSLQLKQLEDDQLIKRQVFTDKAPLRVEYEMTKFGKTLLPLLNEIQKWGKTAIHKSNKVKVE